MTKLIQAYLADKSLKNARKITAYETKHPFSRLMLTTEEGDVVAEAFRQVNG